MTLFELVHIVCVVSLSIYGLNSLLLSWLYLRHRHDRVVMPAPPDEWPRVTVQLPLYNERHMVERLLAAATAMDYPRDRLEIQVLDDSTDDTRPLVARIVSRLRRKGANVVHLTREERTGFKGGALAAGLTSATGEFIAVFDADFVPPRDFLRRVLPHFADPRVGCVQTRWGHMNRTYSRFTQTQALGLDGHFIVEQTARSRSGLFINFNGSGGVWRKSCIDDAGGWSADTLTEDLDLSYRAQIRGWRISYLPEVIVPAELPAQAIAFKRQQARWAQGSIETALKVTGLLLRSSHPWTVKVEGLIHLTSYLVHPLMLAMVVLSLPVGGLQNWGLKTVPWLMAAAAGPPLLYAIAALAGGPNPGRRLRALPMLVLLGTGIALCNTLAVLRALLKRGQSFQRTPKFDLHQSGDQWVASTYALGADALTLGEVALALSAIAALSVTGIRWGAGTWMLVYCGGFGYVASVTIVQTLQRWRWLATQTSHR